ncbi:alpha/beta fold hydrolase [uncultured Porphyromonas sp.]|uniref:alpha/beta fold hydrolase n=1 Tax=uncultured Porphyromonas sp. TaxID=159274 RepID=UPI0025FAE56E|nr:alpha/beta fold hydrolase [uncultured Porphyromonas sp.]
MLGQVTLTDFTNWRGESIPSITLTYQVEGPSLGSAPIVLVCHALTGNSAVSGPEGWWAKLIGPGQTIDTARYTILSIDIPGNEYAGSAPLDDPSLLNVKDVARLWLLVLRELRVDHLYALIGPSLGGGLAWQIATLEPTLADLLFPIATDYKASDWLLAQTEVQRLILEHSDRPIHDARVHAMLTYRTPKSLIGRFEGKKVEDSGLPKVIDWLDYHGRTLEGRFSLSAYRVMTFLTSTIHAAESEEELSRIASDIHLIAIDSDRLFPYFIARETIERLRCSGKEHAELHTIASDHGHDAFLIEYDQLCRIMSPFFP